MGLNKYKYLNEHHLGKVLYKSECNEPKLR